MAGITALFYALTGVHKPWVMLFYNALLHAFAFVVLIGLLTLLGFERRASLLASLPFLLFPSSLTWTAQIHRDGLYIAGFYLIFLSLLLLIKKNSLYSLALLSIGVFMVYISRPHMLIPLKYTIAILSLIFFILFVYNFITRKEYNKAVLKLVLSILMVFIINPFLSKMQAQTAQTEMQVQTAQTEIQAQTAQAQTIQPDWIKTPFLPEKLDNMFRVLAEIRKSFVEYYTNKPGNIDHDFVPCSLLDFIKYTPRAMQIGLFSPFPNIWFTKGGTASGTIARYITPFEAVFVYLCLAISPWVIYRFRKDLAFWTLLFISLLFIWLHVLSEPNFGAIYRKRYAFIMFLTAMSVATVLENKDRLRLKWLKR